MHDPDTDARPMGLVPTTGRGSMPFMLLGGEPLVALASWALEAAGVELVEYHVELAGLADRHRPLIIHDPLCPLTSVEFLQQALAIAIEEDVVVVGVQPVTDTIKTVAGGVVGDTVDRESLWSVTSPVILPASLVATLAAWPDADDLPALVARLRQVARVRCVEAPALGRRVEDQSSVVLLEALAGR